MPLASTKSTPATRPTAGVARSKKPIGIVANGVTKRKTAATDAVAVVAPVPTSLKDNGEMRVPSPVEGKDTSGLTTQTPEVSSDVSSATPPATTASTLHKLHVRDEHKPSRLAQHHHLQMLEDMDRKARELCDDTRRQYELLLQRQDANHERQLQALQHKLKDVLSSSITLSEHRHALSEMARAHERDTRALVKVHDDETAQLHRRCKQIANDQQVSRSRAFQEEKDFLLDKIAQLEMDRNGALRQWREEELVVLGLRAEAEELAQAKQLAETKLQEACQHIISLKAQLPKIDRLSTKVKAERETHAAAIAQLQQRLVETTEAKSELTTRMSVLETELKHVRSACVAHMSELAEAKTALAMRDTQATELQRTVAELTTKETLLREFRDGERAAHDAERNEWRASIERVQTQENDARQQAAALQQEKQAADAQCQLLARDVARVTDERTQSEQALIAKLRALQAKYAAAKKQVAQLQAQHAELQDEERVNQLLFAGRR